MGKKIITPSNLEWPNDWDITEVGLSQSMISMWMTCRRMFLFHINGYYVPRKEEKTNFGSVVHEVNDRVYTKNKYPTVREIQGYIEEYFQQRLKDGSVVTMQQIETDAAKAEATLIEYFKYYESDFKTKDFFDVEQVFSVGFNIAKIHGKIDGKYLAKNGKKWLMEHKTKGQINENSILLHLPIDFQNHMYLLADEIKTGKKAIGVLYNVIRNSLAKLLKNERVVNYKKRIAEQCSKNPDHFFKRWESAYTSEEREIFQLNLGRTVYEIHAASNLAVVPNCWACINPWPCQFLKACSENSMSPLCKKEEPASQRLFPELQEPSFTPIYTVESVYNKLGLTKKKEHTNASKKTSEEFATRKKFAKRVKKKISRK